MGNKTHKININSRVGAHVHALLCHILGLKLHQSQP